ncbi:MAG: DUF5615 family PIN-like protein [Bacteroidetes bacterium]|nr:DUF5615 family PIN-like protein [Bacteroidota bacterium]
MKILLDECVTKHLKRFLSDYDVFTVREMGWGGVKNGKLMALCVEHKFDLLLTIDKNLQFQQNLDKYPLTIAVLNSFTSKVEELAEFIPSFRSRIADFEKHKVYLIEIH